MLIRSKVDVVVMLCINPDFGLSSKSLSWSFSRLTLSSHFWPSWKSFWVFFVAVVCLKIVVIAFSSIEFVVFLWIYFLSFSAMISFRLSVENLHDPFHMLVKFCLSRFIAVVILFKAIHNFVCLCEQACDPGHFLFLYLSNSLPPLLITWLQTSRWWLGPLFRRTGYVPFSTSAGAATLSLSFFFQHLVTC